jgi:hypothetical protein
MHVSDGDEDLALSVSFFQVPKRLRASRNP